MGNIKLGVCTGEHCTAFTRACRIYSIPECKNGTCPLGGVKKSAYCRKTSIPRECCLVALLGGVKKSACCRKTSIPRECCLVALLLDINTLWENRL